MKDKSSMKILCIILAAIIFFPAIVGSGSLQEINLKTDDTVIKLNSEKKISVYLETPDGKKLQTNELSIDEAMVIRDHLLQIEKEYQSEEKIRKQMSILHNNELLPDSISLDDYMDRLNTIKRVFKFNEENFQDNNVQPKQFRDPGYIFSGPSIQSTFSLGGRTYRLQLLAGELLRYFFDIELLDYQDNDTLNGTRFLSSAFGGPVYVGISPVAAFITTIGLIISGPVFVYAPFVSFRVLFSGFRISAIIFECENPITVFDWHLNIALIGALVYQSN
ncbi:MAG: hypothetical protein QCI00_04410 [Candidatus Thermoplasmatota archaeon]|nr:hypothetical protein [Candidatus Thermoplasmatota archaeon]